MVQKVERIREETHREECFERTKKPPVKVKWVDRNQGERHHMNVRSRLVAKQINTSGTGQDGHRVCHKGGNEKNDITHQR